LTNFRLLDSRPPAISASTLEISYISIRKQPFLHPNLVN
jgi:hypothetical protein